MAIDTQRKRASAIHVSSPWRSMFPLPDNVIDQGDRQMIAYFYTGILFDPPTPGGSGGHFLLLLGAGT